jgi:prolycopene isomerase
MPSLIDPSVAPPGHHVVHAFTADWIDNWQSLSAEEYERRKEAVAAHICARIEKALLPGLRDAIRLCEVSRTAAAAHTATSLHMLDP